MRLLLADDDAALLQLLARFVRRARPAWSVFTAADGAEALRLLRGGEIDLIVTDIRMPLMDGMALLDAIRRDPRLRDTPLIFATGRTDRSSIRGGMTSGADDYLTKPFSGDELVEAVEARMQRLERAAKADDGRAPERDRLESLLTGRELQVLGLIGRGLVSKEIAERLGVSPNTVRVFRSSIMSKLDLHNSAALAAIAVRNGLS